MVEHGTSVIDEMIELVIKIINQAPHSAAFDLTQQILTIHWQDKPVCSIIIISLIICKIRNNVSPCLKQ